MADYWTKHHPASHHKNMLPEIFTPVDALMEFRNKIERQKDEVALKLKHNSSGKDMCLPARVC